MNVHKNPISGFSKLSKIRKMQWVVENFFKDPDGVMNELISYWHPGLQSILDGFIENSIGNFPIPLGVAPNFKINGKVYAIPMAIEESSVIAAASSAAKFWFDRGGFKAEVIDMKKIGQVHFKWKGDKEKLMSEFDQIEKKLREDTKEITASMEERGGGLNSIQLLDFTDKIPNLYQIRADFYTCESMGANFINTVLEQFATTLKDYVISHDLFKEKDIEIIMSILSNYTPESIVHAEVSCHVDELVSGQSIKDGKLFGEKFKTAVDIARNDPYRATTHNKGIFNGIDAVIIATGNDFRAVEACGHTYAAKDGTYRSLSKCEIDKGVFRFWLDVPMAIGTVGGLTRTHPMAKRSLEMLGNPGVLDLMKIVASVGLAQNFGAVKSLVTTGIQKGHMKLHLSNILTYLEADKKEKEIITDYFKDKIVSFNEVKKQLDKIRKK
ncbi:MAG TPA: hydroxymethylglutaryl-CoA reductase, degradative [Bacteroidetes bacterium]|nr:hydroxymethylglutaryl-CoA reductase, degradative [Bacteroidota bacterium]